jgi:hypothetical protein
VRNDQKSLMFIDHPVLFMPCSYWLVVRPESGVDLSGHLSHFRFGTLLLNLEHSLCHPLFFNIL